MNIIVLGDSIAWGAFDSKNGGWVERLKCSLFAEEVFVYNCAISGDTSSDVLSRMDYEIANRMDTEEGVCIIVAIGANDCGFDNSGVVNTTVEDYIRNIDAIYDKAQKITSGIAFVGLTCIDNERTNPVGWDDNLNYSNESTIKYNEALKDFCKYTGALFIDVIDLDKDRLADGCHPDELMHFKIYERVKKATRNWYELT